MPIRLVGWSARLVEHMLDQLRQGFDREGEMLLAGVLDLDLADAAEALESRRLGQMRVRVTKKKPL